MNFPERRKFTRWKIGAPAKIRFEGALADTDCTVHDINFSGIKISLRPRLRLDKFLRMKIMLCDGYVLEVETWVVWHRSVEGVNLYALYFSKISESDKEKIYKFVYRYFPTEMQVQYKSSLIEEKGGEPMKDRRIFARFETKFPLRFLDLNSVIECQGDACDISAKGMGFVAERELSPCTPLEVWLQIPDKGEPLYSRGEVVWSKRLEPNKCRIGVRLERADLMGLSRVLRAA